jgi:hypothetical protein
MREPVVCVDGFSYERENLEIWFKQQSSSNTGEANYTSPVTGARLQSVIHFPNINLAKAISRFLRTEVTILSRGSQSVQENELAETEDASLQFNHWTIGKALTLTQHRSVITKSVLPADRVDWYDLIAFSAFPSRYTADEKPRVVFKIEKARTGWGGLTLGFSPLPAERIQAPLLCDFVDANCWWLDGSNWFHTPNGGSVLVPWSTSQIKEGDRVGLLVPSQGRFCVFVNGLKKVDMKDTDLPVKIGTQLFGFVALTGGYDRVRIVQDLPSDWGTEQL